MLWRCRKMIKTALLLTNDKYFCLVKSVSWKMKGWRRKPATPGYPYVTIPCYINITHIKILEITISRVFSLSCSFQGTLYLLGYQYPEVDPWASNLTLYTTKPVDSLCSSINFFWWFICCGEFHRSSKKNIKATLCIVRSGLNIWPSGISLSHILCFCLYWFQGIVPDRGLITRGSIQHTLA